MKIVNIVDDGTITLAHAYDEQGNTLAVPTITAMLAATLSSYIEQGYDPEDRHAVAAALADMLLRQHTPTGCLCPPLQSHPMCPHHGGRGLDDEEEL